MSDQSEVLYAAIEDYVRRAVKPLQDRIAELEGRLVIVHGIDGKDGRDGKSIDPMEVRAMVADAVKALPSAKDGRDGADGKSVDVETVRALVADAVKAIPLPKDGKDGRDGTDGKEGPAGKDGADGKPGRDGIDGKDGAPGLDGKDGLDSTVAGPKGDRGDPGGRGEKGLDGKDGADGLDGKEGAAGRDGRDGTSILSALVDGDGQLILTSSDGTKHIAGYVRGKDGRDGANGKDGAAGRDGAKGDAGRDAADLRPLPYIDDAKSYPAGVLAHHAGGAWWSERQTEALNGRRPQECGWYALAIGEQAFAIDLAEDGRTLVAKRTTSTGLTFEKRWKLPIPIDRGVYSSTKSYDCGDMVSRDGSMFIARTDAPSGLPGASDDWRLAVKRGKDGADAR